MKKAFIITIDKGTEIFDTFSYQGFQNGIEAMPSLVTWWHYLHSTYIVVTEPTTTAEQITNYLRPFAHNNKQFFVCQLNLRDHGGFLPKDAWDWIQAQIRITR